MLKTLGWILSVVLLLVIAIRGVKLLALSDDLRNAQGDIDSSMTEIADAQVNSTRAVEELECCLDRGFVLDSYRRSQQPRK